MPFTSYGAWKTDRITLDFGAGLLSFSEGAARRLGLQQFDEEYSYQGGRLRLGFDILVDPVSGYAGVRRWAVWDGESYSLYTGLGDVQSGTMLALLDAFIIEETAFGVTITPKDPAVSRPVGSPKYPRLYKIVPGVGLLDVHELTEAHRRSLPPWPGQQVRGGDLYRLDHVHTDDGREQARLTLVGATAFTTIEADPGVDESEYLSRLSDLVVDCPGAS